MKWSKIYVNCVVTRVTFLPVQSGSRDAASCLSDNAGLRVWLIHARSWRLNKTAVSTFYQLQSCPVICSDAEISALPHKQSKAWIRINVIWIRSNEPREANLTFAALEWRRECDSSCFVEGNSINTRRGNAALPLPPHSRCSSRRPSRYLPRSRYSHHPDAVNPLFDQAPCSEEREGCAASFHVHKPQRCRLPFQL